MLIQAQILALAESNRVRRILGNASGNGRGALGGGPTAAAGNDAPGNGRGAFGNGRDASGNGPGAPEAAALDLWAKYLPSGHATGGHKGPAGKAQRRGQPVMQSVALGDDDPRPNAVSGPSQGMRSSTSPESATKQ